MQHAAARLLGVINLLSSWLLHDQLNLCALTANIAEFIYM